MGRAATILVAGVMLVAPACTGAPAVPAPSPGVTAVPAPVPSVSAGASSPPSATPAPPPVVATWPHPTPTPTPTIAPAPTPTPSATITTRPQPTASCAIPANLKGKDLSSMPGAGKTIALTFDGGASNQGTARILQTLADTGAPATFFLTGDFARRYPGDSTAIARRYPVGNHSQTHPDLTTLPDAAVRAQIADAQVSIKAAAGVDPRPYFRFPFGARDARTIALVNDACYVPFRWTVDTLGWKGTSDGMSAEKVTQRVLDGASDGGVILMHLGAHPTDGSTLDADALPGIIAGLKAKGYTLVTLETVI